MSDAHDHQPPEPIEVNRPARQRLLAILGSGGVSYCYQCGACVGDCPSARFYPGFNPREIMLTALLGGIDRLIGPDSVIWQCSNCYNCYERCPQDVRPVEVIIALKNLARLEGEPPPEVRGVYETILKTGRSAPVIGGLDRKRESLGLPPLGRIDVAEITAILAPESDATDCRSTTGGSQEERA
jgi:heterodisulfide reductase subunit C2